MITLDDWFGCDAWKLLGGSECLRRVSERC